MKIVDLVEEPYKSQLMDAGLDKLELVDYVNNNDSGSHSGFCAIAFRDPVTDERGMTFRGTENLDNLLGGNQIDMIDNISTAITGESKQEKEALEFFQRNKSDCGNNYLYGHSKGGELASEVYVEYYSEIQEMHVLNPQPINPHLLTEEQREALKGDKVDVVIIDGDTVHSLGGWPFSDKNTRIIENNETKDVFFGPHYKESAKLEGNNYVIEKEPFKEYPEQLEFCNLVKPIIETAQKIYNNQKDAIANPQIVVDAYKLDSYAQRLRTVNTRINNLDKRLDSLYGRVGLLDLWNLIQADVLTCQSQRLSRCISYLGDTAADFNSIEKDLVNILQ